MSENNLNISKYALELQQKEDRISEWEKYGHSMGLLDTEYCRMPKIEYWHLG